MTKKPKKDAKRKEPAPSRPTERDDDQELDDLPVRVGVFTQQELAFGDIMRAIFGTLTDAYQDGLSRKELRKASGVKKKTLRRIEGMDLNAPIGDVLRVLAATNKTLAVVPLNSASPDAAQDAFDSLEQVLAEAETALAEQEETVEKAPD